MLQRYSDTRRDKVDISSVFVPILLKINSTLFYKHIYRHLDAFRPLREGQHFAFFRQAEPISQLIENEVFICFYTRLSLSLRNA